MNGRIAGGGLRVGLCPDPAFANLARPEGPTLLFVTAMLAGTAVVHLGDRAGRPTARGAQSGASSSMGSPTRT